MTTAHRPDTLAAEVRGHVADLATRSVPHLAQFADCQCPANHKGDPRGADGRRFLSHVAGQTADALADILDDELGPDATAAEITAAVERFRDGEDDDNRALDIADGAPSVWTATRWAEFVDLAAWQEDVSEWDGAGAELTDLAGYALAEIARRLVDALAGEVVELAQQYAEDDETPAPTVREIAAEFADDARVVQVGVPVADAATVHVDLAGGAYVSITDVHDFVDPDAETIVGYSFVVYGPPGANDGPLDEVLAIGGDGYDGDPATYSLRHELARLIADWHHEPVDAETSDEQNGADQ